MAYDIRYARSEEFPAIADLDGASFGFDYSEQELEDALLDVDPEGMLVAVDDGRIVGASCEVPFTMTLPGGSIDALGLTWVSVELTHRRRGILRALMDRQLRAAAERGVAVSILTASESGIYGRYGFGVATRTRHTVIDRRVARLARPVADHGVTRMPTDQAREVLPGIYDRWRRATPGGLDRNTKRWQLQLLDRDWQRNGRSALFHLVHPDGYASYRIASDGDLIGTGNTCVVTDYAVCTPQAHAGLWQVLLGMDLCALIKSNRVAADDPLPHLLTDPRQVTTMALNDGLWVRPLDVAALLAARCYALDLDVVVGVRDGLLGDAAYRLRGATSGATCTRVDDRADVELAVSTLGAVALGGVRVAELVRAGLITGDRSVLTRLDRAFLADVEPQLGTYF